MAELTEAEKSNAYEQSLKVNTFLTRFVKCDDWPAARSNLVELMKESAEIGIDMLAATKKGRVHDLECMLMVYEATVYCMLPFFKQSPHHQIMMSQVSCCADAHQKTMGEPAMFADQVPPYKPDERLTK